MSNHAISFLYRRDWPDEESDDENNQVMDSFFGGSKQTEKKPDAKAGELPKKAPEPQKTDPKKSNSCQPKPKRKPAKKSQSICHKIIKKAKSASKCKKPAKKKIDTKCGNTPRSQNPFIIFYLTMLSKQKCKRAVEVAREAGKQWCSLDLKTKEMYRNLAKAERLRRKRQNKGARKRKCR